MPEAAQKLDGLLDTWGRRNRKHSDRECEACGNFYRPKNAASRFCSRPCLWSTNGKNQRKSPRVWWVNSNGYIEGRVLTAQGERRVKQHRFFMELHLGRLLHPDEDVHHVNGDKADNRIANLEVIDHAEHTRQHNAERRAAISAAKGEAQ